MATTQAHKQTTKQTSALTRPSKPANGLAILRVEGICSICRIAILHATMHILYMPDFIISYKIAYILYASL